MEEDFLTLKCIGCGKSKKKTDFSKTPITKVNKGYELYCKSCKKDLIKTKDDLINYLKQHEIKYEEHTYKTAYEYIKKRELKKYKKDDFPDDFEEKFFSAIIGKYFSLINLFGDSKASHLSKNDNNKQTKLGKEDIEIDEYLTEKWGEGYQPLEYQMFEKKWNSLINNYGEKTALHTENLKVYIRYRIKEQMSSAKGDIKEAKEWGVLASKAATDAKINVSQLSKSDISGGIDLVCQIFEAVETELGVIPLFPQLLAQPYDDADIILWCNINYGRRLDDKPRVSYRDIWNFYDEMLEEVCIQRGLSEEQIINFKKERVNIFRDLELVYKEPAYQDGDL